MPATAFAAPITDDFRTDGGLARTPRVAHLLRYEDLVADPHDCLRRLTASAGIDDSPAVIERMVAAGRAESVQTRAHRTTEHASRSIRRYDAR
jgi:hypothetical protein